MTNILIVEEHPLMRIGLSQVVSRSFPQCAIGEASNGAEAMRLLPERLWNLAVLDISLPGRSGLDLLKEIRTARPALPVLMLTADDGAQFCARAIRAGATGCIARTSAPEVLSDAIRQTAIGRKLIAPEVAALLASDAATGAPHEQLSDREYDILVRIGRGQSVGQIAQDLNLSVKTVSTYRARVLEKMRLHNNAELVQYAIRNGLVE